MGSQDALKLELFGYTIDLSLEPIRQWWAEVCARNHERRLEDSVPLAPDADCPSCGADFAHRQVVEREGYTSHLCRCCRAEFPVNLV